MACTAITLEDYCYRRVTLLQSPHVASYPGSFLCGKWKSGYPTSTFANTHTHASHNMIRV